MTLTELTELLSGMSADDLRFVADSFVSDSTGDEVDAWQATLAIDRTLRHTHRARQAAGAARSAAQAVQVAAERAGMALPAADVTVVARAAAELARGIVAGGAVAEEMRTLLRRWAPIFATA